MTPVYECNSYSGAKPEVNLVTIAQWAPLIVHLESIGAVLKAGACRVCAAVIDRCLVTSRVLLW